MHARTASLVCIVSLLLLAPLAASAATPLAQPTLSLAPIARTLAQDLQVLVVTGLQRAAPGIQEEGGDKVEIEIQQAPAQRETVVWFFTPTALVIGGIVLLALILVIAAGGNRTTIIKD